MEINEKNIIEADGINEATQAYLDVESQFIDVLKPLVVGAEITSAPYGSGKITGLSGTTLDDFIITIDFAEFTKKFSLKTVADGNRFTKFTDESIYEKWRELSEIHIGLQTTYNTTKSALTQIQVELEKQQAAEQKAKAKFEKQKENSIRAFDSLANRKTIDIGSTDEFYYAIGWLANHIGTLSAVMPDYLESAFIAHFGDNVPVTIVDSTKKTSNGNAMQWTFAFKATLKNPDNIPTYLDKYLSTSKKAVTNTSFIWDLVESCGFTFGKKQNIDIIKSKIPAQYITSFESGLSA